MYFPYVLFASKSYDHLIYTNFCVSLLKHWYNKNSNDFILDRYLFCSRIVFIMIYMKTCIKRTPLLVFALKMCPAFHSVFFNMYVYMLLSRKRNKPYCTMLMKHHPVSLVRLLYNIVWRYNVWFAFKLEIMR